ncbi:MAG TPA: thiol reductant ABC exporter subunit CydC [Casimicrobiaceae bacterium]|nr:thiol reductant ABC exporter subunit CydC [Casimicrobiaceae bacterium]
MNGELRVLMRLLRVFRPYRAWMALGAAIATATLLANIGLMAVAGWFIASMALAGAAGVLMNYFLPAALIRLFAILRTGGRYAERLVTHEATFRLLAELRVWFFRSIEPLAPAILARHRSGDLVTRVQADIDTLQNAYLRLFSPAAVAATGAAVVTAVLCTYSVAIAAIALALLLAAGIAVPLAARSAGREPGVALVETRAALRVAVLDAVQGMADLAVYGGSARAAARVAKLTRRALDAQRRLARQSARSEAAAAMCASLAMWGTALVAIALVGRGELDPAEVPMLALAVLASFEAVGPLPAAFHRLGETVAAARRIFALADAPSPIELPSTPSPKPRDFGFAMRGVRMRYDPDGPWALDGIDLEVANGTRVGIIGPSGAGKSSLVNVLLRFHEFESGQVRLGGHDLRRYAPSELRRMMCVVSQDTYLFNATILDNLRLADPDADEAAVVRAAQGAQIHDFVASLPQGYATWVGETGVRLSAGQARRVAVARALLRDAPILLLDEPTESLDAPTAQAMLESLSALARNRTVLLVTHDLAALRALVDEVVLIEGGRVATRPLPVG